MLINKVTVGFVIQVFDTEKKAFVDQNFIAGDEVSYEDQYGKAVDPQYMHTLDGKTPYLPFDMVQPDDMVEHE